GLLARLPETARILVLERGPDYPLETQLANRRVHPVEPDTLIDGSRSVKRWPFTVALGGSSNCWWACTPRMLPEDFELASRYGVGRDWPVTYEMLEPFYAEAEAIMEISGDGNTDLWPRSTPFPQPPHRLTAPDRILAKAHPGRYFVQPAARARIATATRPACCATGICELCPIGAKFSIARDMASVFQDPRVELRVGAEVLQVMRQGGRVTGVTYRMGEEVREARADAVALGCNAIFNAAILLRSGFEHPLLGRRLHEQVGIFADIDLAGIENFDGSSSISGHGYMLYGGEHRREAAACLIESWNVPQLRPEPGRWRERMRMKFIFEALPHEDDSVSLPADPFGPPVVRYEKHGSYVAAGRARAELLLPALLASLPVENIRWHEDWLDHEAHNLGTVVMGEDPATSCVDPGLRWHGADNLWVLGGSAYPTGAPANPTLTLSALSLRAASMV
ncbi:MAG: GMC family oxidoreductase, partial [Pseudomonadota bacterium]